MCGIGENGINKWYNLGSEMLSKSTKVNRQQNKTKEKQKKRQLTRTKITGGRSVWESRIKSDIILGFTRNT